ncbi:DUF3817 domain-containing protein [Robiginitalea sp. IMCC44478]|uniref:DUF3817 domain-containing protein n=1 Tax=Robiginitalea sp. IMCC44478 TaxID=3459122 RepID=UPI004042A2D0
MFKIFRSVALLEGISYLMLFALSMPLKHWGDIPEPNLYIGYAHGFLFLAYLALAVMVWMERKWKIKQLIVMVAAGLLPFGTFYLINHYFKYQFK